MSLSSSLGAALSGLSASARAAEIVSSNVANSRTEGYGVRRVELAAQGQGVGGAGVRVAAITRMEDVRLLTDRRTADGADAAATQTANFNRRVEDAIGSPEDPQSIAAALTRMEGALVEAASRPESSARLSTVLSAAQTVTDRIQSVSNEIEQARQDADAAIGKTVDRLNADLEKVQDLNRQIRSLSGSGRDVAALMDQRQQAVDRIAAEIPVQQVDRGRGQIALFSNGGLPLLEGNAVTISFSPTPVITPDMSVGSGALSLLTVNGVEIDPTDSRASIKGGRLEALFQTRDIDVPKAQARMDAVARDLIERFEDPNTDPTRAGGSPGLLTDAGAAFDPAREVGLAGRIAINAAVDPAQGGTLSLLRDGIGATVAGPVGNADQIQRWSDALSGSRAQASGEFVGAARTASGLVSDLLSMVSADRSSAEVVESFSAAKAIALREEEARLGVDTDFEMQQLLIIEQAYAANARIIEVVGDMFDRLSRI